MFITLPKCCRHYGRCIIPLYKLSPPGQGDGINTSNVYEAGGGEGRNFLLHSSNNTTTKCKPASNFHHAFGGFHLLLSLCRLKLRVAGTLPPSHPLATSKKRRRCFLSSRKVRITPTPFVQSDSMAIQIPPHPPENLFLVVLVYLRDLVPQITGGIFTRNTADYGGFLYAESKSKTVCAGVFVMGHTAVYGGAIYATEEAVLDWACDLAGNEALLGPAM